MKFRMGTKEDVMPTWKGKPKASPVDTDIEFLKLRNAILQGQLKPFEAAAIEIHEDVDGKRLNTKNPARLIRDHLNRILKDTNLAPDYVVTCRQTDAPGVWGVVVVHEPRESAIGATKVDRRRRTR